MANFDNTSELAWLQYTKKLEDPANQNLSERDQAALFSQCVESQVLKSPASAVFPSLAEVVVNGSNGHYSVSGFVDSQNSYGAMIRSTYSYNVEKNSSGKWQCTNTFVDSSVSINREINAQMTSNTILWWILGILGTIISISVTSCQMSSLF